MTHIVRADVDQGEVGAASQNNAKLQVALERVVLLRVSEGLQRVPVHLNEGAECLRTASALKAEHSETRQAETA